MGNFVGKILKKIIRCSKEMKIIIVGLDGAGKTTILYRLKLGEVATAKVPTTPIPTIGFNIETVKYKNILFNVWDIGGQEKTRCLWKHYYDDADGIIFVLDSSDMDRIDHNNYYSNYDNCNKHCACDELQQIFGETVSNKCPILILANKQDLFNTMSIDEICQRLGLLNIENRKWHLQATCGITGEGLRQGLTWLSKNVAK